MAIKKVRQLTYFSRPHLVVVGYNIRDLKWKKIWIQDKHFGFPSPIASNLGSYCLYTGTGNVLTQQVLNGQIGSPKSFKFQELFSQWKHRLRTLIFFLMFPYLPNFNPKKQKPAISVCGPRQLIVNSRQSSQNMKNVWCRFLPYKGRELYILKWQFYGEYFFLNSS